MKIRIAAHAGAAFTLAYCAITNANPLGAQAARAFSGCYQFDRAYFQWVGRRPASSVVVIDSTRLVRLTEHEQQARPPSIGSAWGVVPVPFDADSTTTRRWFRDSYWTMTDSATMNVAWRNGFYGPVFTLTVVGDTLRGLVRHTTDVIGAEPPPEHAAALRVACP